MNVPRKSWSGKSFYRILNQVKQTKIKTEEMRKFGFLTVFILVSEDIFAIRSLT